MKINLTLIALGAAVLAPPAGAHGNGGEQDRGAAAGAAQEKKYCVQLEPVTGSRITQQACKTKAEWAKENVDVDALVKGK